MRGPSARQLRITMENWSSFGWAGCDASSSAPSLLLSASSARSASASVTVLSSAACANGVAAAVRPAAGAARHPGPAAASNAASEAVTVAGKRPLLLALLRSTRPPGDEVAAAEVAAAELAASELPPLAGACTEAVRAVSSSSPGL